METATLHNRGNNNLANTGHLTHDCIVINEEINFNIFFMKNDEMTNRLLETIDTLKELSKSQIALSESILKQKENESKHAEAFVIMARVAENNSLANLNTSKSLLLKDEICERLIKILESYKK